jgi:hypothetical protein
MTIEIEAGASHSQCGMNSSRHHKFFHSVFLIYLNSTTPF